MSIITAALDSSWITFDSNTLTVSWYTLSANAVGVYQITITGSVAAATTQTGSVTFQITVTLTPTCLLATDTFSIFVPSVLPINKQYVVGDV